VPLSLTRILYAVVTMSPPPVRDVLQAAVSAIGGAERPGQVAMAEAVAAALDAGEHLLVQAGTGTGKSLAYLVPALTHAERVVVATATLALQRQLVERDLPRTVRALRPMLDREPAFAILKGRSNYLCLQRVHDGAPADQDTLFSASPTSALGRDVVRLRAWANETETGDRDDLSPGVADRAWAQLSVSSRECLGAARCPYGQECFAELARERARFADVVVTNHALLAIDALEEVNVLPEHDVVVVDEAHELVSRVTAVATGELTAAMVARASRRSARLADEAAVDALAAAGEAFGEALGELPPGRLRELEPRLGWALAALRDAARQVVSALAGVRDRGVADEDSVRRQALAALEGVLEVVERVLSASVHDVCWIERNERFGIALKVAPLSVAGLLRTRLFGGRTVVLTSATLRLGGEFEHAARSVGLHPLGRRDQAPGATPAPEPVATTSSVVAAARPAAVIPVQEGGRADADRRAPAARERDQAAERGDQGAERGTQAAERTDQAAESADAARQDEDQAEPDDADLPMWRAVDVGSPFDYPRQGILYVARRLPPPGRDGIRPEVVTELAELITAAGGRTLGLFSSMRAARAAADQMRERLSYPVLCQGEDSLPELLRQFAADPGTCLFGTLSLWQGVDVPGPACQLVVIDRIPFPRPDDPLMSARQQAVDAAGGNGFLSVAASHAALLLAQGAGRLVRSASDRGVVAVLDSRLATARYAGFLRASLPAFWYTTDPAQVRRSLAAIDEAAVTSCATP
jgi:ATP-dependent DNA helicase DinG